MKSFTIIFFIFVFSACSFNKPEKVILKFLDHQKNGEFKEAYALLSKDDQAFKSLKQFDQKNSALYKQLQPMIKKLSERVQFKVTQVDNKDNLWIVVIKSTAPDLDEAINTSLNTNEELHLVKNKAEISELTTSKIKEYINNNHDMPLVTKEKVYYVVKEGGDYKVFMNYGLEPRRKELQVKINEIRKTFDYQLGKKLIEEFKKSTHSDGYDIELDEMNHYINHTASLFETKEIGSLEFTPLTVEVKKVEFFKSNFHDATKYLSNNKMFVLTYKVKNISDNQLFAPVNNSADTNSISSFVVDNYGNKMIEVDLGDQTFVDKERLRRLQPGEEMILHEICSLPNDIKTGKYFWTIRLRTNDYSKNSIQNAYVAFSGADIRYY